MLFFWYMAKVLDEKLISLLSEWKFKLSDKDFPFKRWAIFSTQIINIFASNAAWFFLISKNIYFTKFGSQANSWLMYPLQFSIFTKAYTYYYAPKLRLLNLCLSTWHWVCMESICDVQTPETSDFYVDFSNYGVVLTPTRGRNCHTRPSET